MDLTSDCRTRSYSRTNVVLKYVQQHTSKLHIHSGVFPYFTVCFGTLHNRKKRCTKSTPNQPTSCTYITAPTHVPFSYPMVTIINFMLDKSFWCLFLFRCLDVLSSCGRFDWVSGYWVVKGASYSKPKMHSARRVPRYMIVQ